MAGGIHPKSGERSTIVLETGNIFELDALMALCPELPVEEKSTSTTGTIWRADPDNVDIDPEDGGYGFHWDASEHHLQGVTVPLSVALGPETLAEIENGVAAGEGRRAGRAGSIGRLAQCADAQRDELGVPFTGSAEELFTQFVTASGLVDDYCFGDVEVAFDKHWEQGDIGEGDLSRWALTRKLADIEFRQLVTNPKPGSWLWRGLQASRKAWKQLITARAQARKAQIALAAEVRRKGRPAKPLDARIDLLDRYIQALVANIRNSSRRMAKLREAHKALGLSTAIPSRELSTLILEKQDEKAGNTYKSLTAADRAAMPTPKVEWLIGNAIPKSDLTIVGGRPKVGKSRVGLWLTKVLLTGTDFLGMGSPAEKHKVILVTDDQGDGDTADMLKNLGVYSHPGLLWSRRFRVTGKQLDALLADIEANPGAVVIIDSLRSVTRSSGLSENDPELGVLLYDLKQSVLDAGGSMVLIHHASKSNDHVGQEALSGHNSIPSAANTILTLHYLPGEGNSLQKNIPERRLVREARSGPGFDLVVTMHDDVTFTKLEDFEQFQQRQLEAEQGAKGTHALRSITNDLQKVLLALLADAEAEGNGLGVLEMLIQAGLAPKTAKNKRDLGKGGSKYVSTSRGMRRFIGLGLVEEVTDVGSWSGQGSLYRLTEKGRAAVDEELNG